MQKEEKSISRQLRERGIAKDEIHFDTPKIAKFDKISKIRERKVENHLKPIKIYVSHQYDKKSIS